MRPIARDGLRACAALLLIPIATVAAGRHGALIEAVKAKDLQAARALLQQAVDVNATEPDGSTALHWAAYRDDVAMVDALLEADANANVTTRFGATPLSLAATNGNAAVIERLLGAGVDPNAATSGSETALMTAARAGSAAVVRVLLAHGADPNAREQTRGQTALMWAAAQGHHEVIRALVAAGADIRATSRAPVAAAVTEGRRGDDRYQRTVPRIDVFTPLLFAVRAGRLSAVRALLDAGADVNETLPSGMSASTLATVNAHYELAALLLDQGADPNASQQGWTPLHQVVRTRTLGVGWIPHPVPTGRLSSMDLAKKLLAHGARIDARMTKRIVDGWRGSFNFVGATPFLLAAKGADLEMMRFLVAEGADVSAVNANGTNALMLGAGVELFNQNEDGGTNEEALEVTKFALELGGDVNVANKNGDTPLHGAAYRGANAVVQLLVDRGARLDPRNKRGLTPLQVANGDVPALQGIQRRPPTVALLRELMLARALKPLTKSEEEAAGIWPGPK